MPTQTIDINELHFNVFGYVAPPFPTELKQIGEQRDYEALKQSNEALKGLRKDFTGREMRMPLTLTAGEKKVKFKTEPMLSVKGANKIVRRYPNRSQTGGSIKERWSSDDYSITIKGILLDHEKDEYPTAQMEALRAVCEYKGALEVTENPMCRVFGIERLVIKDYAFPYTPGWHAQGYHINAWSDVLFDALLEN